MSAVYNPQAEVMAEIQRLEAEARELRRRLTLAAGKEDRKVLSRQLEETEQAISRLQARLD
ncbi:MAG: hypothetical protein NZ561_06795 [Phycisphaerae bacterium]|nr:hypothetical protein [Phycisphaerae bacterium]MDW8261253.1 hypothetical protein [Phycisphaerales bacterium]